MTTEFQSAVGRLVQGSVLTGSDKDSKGNDRITKTGPNKGQPYTSYFMAVAYRKDDPNWPAFYAQIYNEGRTGYPQYFGADGRPTHPRFTFKIADGDGIDDDGKPNNTKEGFAGHWVVKFSSSFAPKLWDALTGQYCVDPGRVKRGWFVSVMGNIKPNIGSDVPGVYINHTGVVLVAYGPEIVSGPDVAAMHAASGQQALPQGATLTPPMPTPGMGMPPQGGPQGPGAGMPPPQQQYAPPPQGAGAGMPPPPQQQGMAPPPQLQYQAPPQQQGMAPPPQLPPQQGMPQNHAFVQNAIGAGGLPPPPLQQQGPMYAITPLGAPYTREQYHAAGYTDAVLLAEGRMIQTA